MMPLEEEHRSWRNPNGVKGAALEAHGQEYAYEGRRCMFDPWVGKIAWRRKWQPILLFLPGKPHGQRSLAGYSPWGRKESDTAW